LGTEKNCHGRYYPEMIEALIELLVEKGIITKDELMGKMEVGVYLNRNSLISSGMVIIEYS